MKIFLMNHSFIFIGQSLSRQGQGIETTREPFTHCCIQEVDQCVKAVLLQYSSGRGVAIPNLEVEVQD